TPGGVMSIIAGTQNSGGFANGVPGTGKLNNPYQIAIGADGSLYIADYSSQRVRKVPSTTPGVVPVNGSMTTIAGGGSKPIANLVSATAASLNGPIGVAVDPATDEVYFSNYSDFQVWKFA